MDPRIYESGASESPPFAPSNPSAGYPTDGNPATGTPATLPGAHWFYKIGESLRRVIVSAGLTPSDDDLDLLLNSIDARSMRPSERIGEVFYIDTSKAGADIPNNAGLARYIQLTAGLDGVGEFNFGLLTNESITGTAPLVVATAEIADNESSMFGETIELLNTENRYLMPGESPGLIANDQIQGHGHDINFDDNIGSLGTAIGSSTRNNQIDGAIVNAANVLSNNGNGAPRTGDHTNVKHKIVTAYMRIR